MALKDDQTRLNSIQHYNGKCNFCTLSCGHEFISYNDMPKVVHDIINSLESGCGHLPDKHMVCDSCRDLMVTVIWQLHHGERVG
jgi:hypothetical protein